LHQKNKVWRFGLNSTINSTMNYKDNCQALMYAVMNFAFHKRGAISVLLYKYCLLKIYFASSRYLVTFFRNHNAFACFIRTIWILVFYVYLCDSFTHILFCCHYFFAQILCSNAVCILPVYSLWFFILSSLQFSSYIYFNCDC
jgi:hypothetical protein